MKLHLLFAMSLSLIAMVILFGRAEARADLVQCEPAAGATVTTAPSQLRCSFSEELDTKQSTLAVRDAAGARVDQSDAHVDLNDPDHKQLVAGLDVTKMKDGMYTVSWHSVSAQDHDAVDGTFIFVVGAGAERAVQAGGNPAIRIVAPTNNRVLPLGDLQVQIATENFSLGGSNYWRLFVDDYLVSKVGQGATSYTTQITASGPHQIKVTLGDGQREDIASATIEVLTAPATPQNAPFNLPWMGPAMAVLAVGIVLLLLVALRMTRPPRG